MRDGLPALNRTRAEYLETAASLSREALAIGPLAMLSTEPSKSWHALGRRLLDANRFVDDARLLPGGGELAEALRLKENVERAREDAWERIGQRADEPAEVVPEMRAGVVVCGECFDEGAPPRLVKAAPGEYERRCWRHLYERLASGGYPLIGPVWARYGGRCRFHDGLDGRCGGYMAETERPRRWQEDHIQPSSKGGPDADLNFMLLCASHNSRKGGKPWGEYGAAMTGLTLAEMYLENEARIGFAAELAARGASSAEIAAAVNARWP